MAARFSTVECWPAQSPAINSVPICARSISITARTYRARASRNIHLEGPARRGPNDARRIDSTYRRVHRHHKISRRAHGAAEEDSRNILAVGGFRESVLVRHMQYGTFNFRDIANI